jgi:hypothetical protein
MSEVSIRDIEAFLDSLSMRDVARFVALWESIPSNVPIPRASLAFHGEDEIVRSFCATLVMWKLEKP